MVREQWSPVKGLVGGQYKPLTDAQVQRIHKAALNILACTGVQVEEPERRCGCSRRQART